MLRRNFEKLLVHPDDLSPSADNLRVIGAFNPGAIKVADEVLLMVRVAEQPRERRVDFVPLPRWQEGRVVVDWIAEDELERLDSRVVRRRSDGLLRLTFTSHLQLLHSRDGRLIQHQGVRILPESSYEEFGIEDPRITWINDRAYITYVCVSRHGVGTALASTKDFRSFQRLGLIFCPENKDVVLFPEQIDGVYTALHRPTAAHAFCMPEIWLARSGDLLSWGGHQPLSGGLNEWESNRVGAGAPPIRTDHGWLEIYHASRNSNASGQVGTYSGGAMLLDLRNPSRVISRSAAPILEPHADFERVGFVPNVVFPTAVIRHGDVLQVFYGAADTCTGVVELSLKDVLAELRN